MTTNQYDKLKGVRVYSVVFFAVKKLLGREMHSKENSAERIASNLGRNKNRRKKKRRYFINAGS